MNHAYNEDTDRTVCGELGGRLAWSVSGPPITCPDCRTPNLPAPGVPSVSTEPKAATFSDLGPAETGNPR